MRAGGSGVITIRAKVRILPFFVLGLALIAPAAIAQGESDFVTDTELTFGLPNTCTDTGRACRNNADCPNGNCSAPWQRQPHGQLWRDQHYGTTVMRLTDVSQHGIQGGANGMACGCTKRSRSCWRNGWPSLKEPLLSRRIVSVSRSVSEFAGGTSVRSPECLHFMSW